MVRAEMRVVLSGVRPVYVGLRPGVRDVWVQHERGMRLA